MAAASSFDFTVDYEQFGYLSAEYYTAHGTITSPQPRRATEAPLRCRTGTTGWKRCPRTTPKVKVDEYHDIAMIHSVPSCFAAGTPMGPTAPALTTATVFRGRP